VSATRSRRAVVQSGCWIGAAREGRALIHTYLEAGMVRLEFHDPCGPLEVTQAHAPRLATLEGKRIGFVSNEQWQAFRMLPMLKSLLEQDFSDIEVLPIDAFPQGNLLIGTEETAALVKKSGVDAVIVGNAA
jgi:hypothetical protein